MELSKHEKSATRITLAPRSDESTAAYIAATYSFQFDTRDDVKLTLNDWDIQFANWYKQGPTIRVNMVVDDRSGIRDLGNVALESAGARGDLNYDAYASLDAVLGHTYVVHTKDRNSDLWIRFRIVAMDDYAVTIVGERMSKKTVRKTKADWARAERKRIAEEKKRAAEAERAKKEAARRARRKKD